MTLKSNNSCIKIFIQVLRGKMLNDALIYLDISFLQNYKISEVDSPVILLGNIMFLL